VTEYTGEVLDVEIPDLPDGVRIAFQRPSGELIRVFPKKRVEAIGAAFPTAQVEYVMYEMGSTNISVLRSVGPLPEDSLAEDFDELSKDTLEDLEKNEWRG
jgi:hypothetical protein